MSQDYCRGCGTVLQTTDPNAPGFVPENILLQRKQSICQRCYKITHYGDAGSVQPEAAKIRQNIRKAVDMSKLVVLVVDFSDLTGTVPVWKEFLTDQAYVMAVNKIDLVPRRTAVPEVVDYLKSYLKKLEVNPPLEIIPVSSLKGAGMDKLIRKMTTETAKGDKVALLGATNVGKSSLIKRILTAEKASGTPTVSKFPGTTLGLSNWSILKGRNTLIDTPGLNPGDRLGDILCPKCGSLLAATRMESKLWGVKPGKGLIFGGLFGLENYSPDERVLLAFAAEGTHFHRTGNAKVAELLEEQPDWLGKICKRCRLKLKWKQVEIRLEPDQDIAVAGLGWVSLRGEVADLRLILPEGVRWETRPAVIGKKDRDYTL